MKLFICPSKYGTFFMMFLEPVTGHNSRFRISMLAPPSQIFFRRSTTITPNLDKQNVGRGTNDSTESSNVGAEPLKTRWTIRLSLVDYAPGRSTLRITQPRPSARHPMKLTHSILKSGSARRKFFGVQMRWGSMTNGSSGVWSDGA